MPIVWKLNGRSIAIDDQWCVHWRVQRVGVQNKPPTSQLEYRTFLCSLPLQKLFALESSRLVNDIAFPFEGILGRLESVAWQLLTTDEIGLFADASQKQTIRCHVSLDEPRISLQTINESRFYYVYFCKYNYPKSWKVPTKYFLNKKQFSCLKTIKCNVLISDGVKCEFLFWSLI